MFWTFAAAVVLWVFYPDPTVVNSAEDHRRLTGGFVALMNMGMVACLVVSGWLAAVQEYVWGAGVRSSDWGGCRAFWSVAG